MICSWLHSIQIKKTQNETKKNYKLVQPEITKKSFTRFAMSDNCTPQKQLQKLINSLWFEYKN